MRVENSESPASTDPVKSEESEDEKRAALVRADVQNAPVNRDQTQVTSTKEARGDDKVEGASAQVQRQQDAGETWQQFADTADTSAQAVSGAEETAKDKADKPTQEEEKAEAERIKVRELVNAELIKQGLIRG